MTFVPPASLGPFTFPAPYHTQGIRLTNASNAPQGCEPRQYPYWSTINNHRGRPDLYVFVQRKGLIPIVLRVNKATGQVSLLRELPWAGVSSGEGSYFSDTDPTKLYWLAANELRTTNVETGETATVFTLDAEYGDDLWQAHSSTDDQTHSATARRRRDGPYDVLGVVVYRQGAQKFYLSPSMDECHIDKSGRWLIIEADNDNRILDLDAKTVRVITNEEGALAHLDVGDGIMVGEDDQHEPSATVLWDLTNPSAPRKLLYSTVWGPGAGHVAVRGGRALLSSNWSNELLDVSLADGTYRVVAPGMIDGSDYDHQLRACLDPTGEYAAWVFADAGRFDVCLARVSMASAPPIVIPPTKPPTGGSTVLGQKPYPGDAFGAAIGNRLFDDYAEAGQEPNAGMGVWFLRTCWDVANPPYLTPEASLAKHQREWRAALGLGGQTPNPQ